MMSVDSLQNGQFVCRPGEAAAGEPVQASDLAADGVPGELGGCARRCALVGRHHPAVRHRLLRRDDTRPRKATTLHRMCMDSSLYAA